MVTERQRRRRDLAQENWLRKKQRLAEARTSREKIAAEFDLFRLAAGRLPAGERDQILDEIAGVIRRKRVTLGDFTSVTSRRTSPSLSGNGAPQRAHARVSSSVTHGYGE